MNVKVCGAHGGYADWDCVLDDGHDGDHRDALDRTFDAVPWVPVIEAEKITIGHAEDALDHGRDGTVEIDGVTVAFYVDPFDKDFVWFFNPGDDVDDADDERVIARFEVERTVVRA